MSEERGSATGASLALAFLLGGVLGAALALLFAPEPGSRTRARIRGVAEDLREKTADLTEDIREKVEDVIEKGREILEESKSLITAAYQAGKEAMHRERERLQTQG
ncbi:MAG: YtxH domain-containing protein [Candidatus Methylomirabilales bacterium]